MEKDAKNEHEYLPVLITAFVMLIVTAAAVAVLWYYMDQQAKQTATNNATQVAILQKQITDSNEKTTTVASTTTPTPVISSQIKTGSDAAKQFCNTVDNGNVAYSIIYSEGDSAEFVKCSMGPSNGSAGGGYALIGKKINGTWTAIYRGQQPPSQATITQYTIPSIISGLTS